MAGANAQALVNAMQPPVMGLNFRKPAIDLDPREALLLDNILPKANAGELRGGYRDWVVGVPGQVVSIMPFIGRVTAEDKLLCANDQGEIYDVTSFGAPPVLLTKTYQSDGVWDYTNTSGVTENFLIMVSPAGGYWTYSVTDGLVNRSISGDGAGKKFGAVYNFKDRVWLLEDGTTVGYYLGVSAIWGEATEFDFSPVINQGGYLSFGTNWTYNAGRDIDDYMVVVTTQGEVIVYSGFNPDEADSFALKGVWYVGRIPRGRRCFTTFGGDVFIMSSLGVVALSKLVNGNVANDYDVASSAIQPSLNTRFTSQANDFGWEMEMFYSQSFMLLKLPVQPSGIHKNFVMNTQTGAWGTISGMPMVCTTQVADKVFFGTADGKVCEAFTANSDGEGIDGTEGKPIQGTYMSGYQSFEQGGGVRLKMFQMARPIFVSARPPAVALKMQADYGAILPTVSGGFGREDGGRFNYNEFNNTSWSGSERTYAAWVGLQGMGYYGSLAMVFTGDPGTQYITTNVTMTIGGVM